MKFLLATASSALVAAFVAAEMCTIPQLTTIMTTTFTMPCMTESGLDFTKLTGAPNEAQQMNFCKTPACISFLNAVMAHDPPDCTLPMGNLKFRSQLFDPIQQFCTAADSGEATVTSDDAGNATRGNATASHSNSTSHENTTMPAANTTITKPDTIVADNSSDTTISSQIEGSDDSMSKSNSDTEPATTTTGPTLAPRKSAVESSFAVSACASALGVAALLWLL